jgi:hypothetical protein
MHDLIPQTSNLLGQLALALGDPLLDRDRLAELEIDPTIVVLENVGCFDQPRKGLFYLWLSHHLIGEAVSL